MTDQTMTTTETKSRTRIETLLTWLKAIEERLDHDPLEQLYRSHKRLNHEIERLQARVRELEKCEKQEA